MPRGRPKISIDVECACIKCGTKFLVRSWQIKDGRGKFCSRACYETPGAHRERPGLKVEPTKKQCELCGAEFLIGGLAHRGSQGRRFCSNSCSTKWKYRERILVGGSKKGRILNHQDGYFERLKAAKHPTTGDIQWAAGIYEGEGWCQIMKNPDGTTKTQNASVGQKDRELLDKMRDLFGGYVTDQGLFRTGDYIGKYRGYTWAIHGPRARGFLMTIYQFLTSRRKEQIRKVLEVCEFAPSGNEWIDK
jgi:hypothetical protein